MNGAEFILRAADRPIAVWGREQHVLWAEGEALLIAGRPARVVALSGALHAGVPSPQLKHALEQLDQ